MCTRLCVEVANLQLEIKAKKGKETTLTLGTHTLTQLIPTPCFPVLEPKMGAKAMSYLQKGGNSSSSKEPGVSDIKVWKAFHVVFLLLRELHSLKCRAYATLGNIQEQSLESD